MAGGKANATITNVLNATTPTGASGVPGAWTALNAGAMLLRINSTLSTASSYGTQLTGTGYTAGGSSITTASAASSGASAVTFPNMTGGLSWTNGSGGSWTVESGDLTDNAGTPVRAWWGPFTSQPITVSNGNIFQVAQNGITVSDA